MPLLSQLHLNLLRKPEWKPIRAPWNFVDLEQEAEEAVAALQLLELADEVPTEELGEEQEQPNEEPGDEQEQAEEQEQADEVPAEEPNEGPGDQQEPREDQEQADEETADVYPGFGSVSSLWSQLRRGRPI